MNLEPLLPVTEQNFGTAYVCCLLARAVKRPKSYKPKVKDPMPISQMVKDSIGAILTQFDDYNYCKDPDCPECGANTTIYWSHKLEHWIPFEHYAGLNEQFQLDKTHLWSPKHVCAPGSVKEADGFKMPEYRAFMCLSHGADGTKYPTFGVAYCANPVFSAILKKSQIIVHIPSPDKVANYVPEKYIPFVSKVNFIAEPPF